MIFEIIARIINPAIVILFGGVIVYLVGIVSALSNHKKMIKDAVSGNKSKSEMNRNGEIIESVQKDVYTPDTIRTLETNYNKTCANHNIILHIIPIFTLLGILGTVCGFIQQLNAAGDSASIITSIMDSLKTAFNSTFYGLIATIVLQIVDAASASRIIDEIDADLNDYDRKMNIVAMFNGIKENE
ncbi:MAG: MotA/TolQ/ExbB proton channel family protein [Lachnospiraceae bacterium]|nr:MotA/TolQ/ExbB proton channel family protein [Lachnospiraceae bacterium]